jgi:hypothetical protein
LQELQEKIVKKKTSYAKNMYANMLTDFVHTCVVPYILPTIPRNLIDQLNLEQVEAKNATLEHKREREEMYDVQNQQAADKIFEICSRPPPNKKRPLFHCQVKDFLIASGGQANAAEFLDYFGKVLICCGVVHIVVGTNQPMRCHSIRW